MSVYVAPSIHAVEIGYAVPCGACFIGEVCAATKERTIGKTLGVDENQAYLELLPVANGAGTATVRAELTTLSRARRLYSDSPLRVPACTKWSSARTVPASLMRRSVA
jgi:hypothetical protein